MAASAPGSGGVAQLAERPPFKRMREGSRPSTPTRTTGLRRLGAVDDETAILDRVEAELADVDLALERLDGGTYGRCDACGGPIPDGHLVTEPAARFCPAHQPGPTA